MDADVGRDVKHCLFLLFAAVLAVTPRPALAQVAPPRFGITDNSFLVEEAFNQDAGIFQNIFLVTRTTDRRWDGSFTQEWPLGGVRHQFSFTVPFSVVSGDGAAGDVLINYRYQVWTEDAQGHRPAFAPRATVILPSSAERRPLGAAGAGFQFNLPFSKAYGPFYFHGNAGATWLEARDAQRVAGRDAAGVARGEWLETSSVAGSAIWAARPMFNLTFEAYAQTESLIDAPRERTVILMPGVRTGWNFGERQVVVGLGVPITRGDVHDRGVLLYGSLEMPFRRHP